LDWVFKVEGKE